MVALDTNVFIYFFEKHPVFYAQAEKIIKGIFEGSVDAVCSSLVITELVAGDPQFDIKALSLGNLHITDLTPEIAYTAGRLRHQYNLKTPDAIHIATALSAKANKFYTNDKKLADRKIKGLAVCGL